MRGRTTTLIAAILIGAAGCGPSSGLNLGKVTGKVTFKGQPVKGGTVVFVPDDSQGTTGPQAIGTINNDGTYILASSDSGDGAVVGTHKVSIQGHDPSPVTAKAAPNPEQNPLEFLAAKDQAGKKAIQDSLKSGGGDRTFTGLDGVTYKIITPEKLSKSETSGVTAKVSGGANTINFDIAEDGTVKIN